MKDQVRVLGIDDAPFFFRDERVSVVGALVRVPNYLEAVMRTTVQVDGSDAVDAINHMIKGSRYEEQVHLIMLDGISVGGFNVIDLDRLFDLTSIPVATVTRDPPDMDKMRSALRAHFDDWEVRLEMIARHPSVPLGTKHKPLYVSYVGIDFRELVTLIEKSTVIGALPEPVRMAHLIATAYARGESKGDA